MTPKLSEVILLSEHWYILERAANMGIKEEGVFNERWSAGDPVYCSVLHAWAFFKLYFFVFLRLQEQPGLYAYEAVTDKGEQVHPGPEQLPF